jgi:hypothetical protein
VCNTLLERRGVPYNFSDGQLRFWQPLFAEPHDQLLSNREYSRIFSPFTVYDIKSPIMCIHWGLYETNQLECICILHVTGYFNISVLWQKFDFVELSPEIQAKPVFMDQGAAK